jgi:SAM-dependent methyltransferase
MEKGLYSFEQNGSRKEQLPDWYYLDNGFKDLEAMERYHRPIVDAAIKMLGERPGRIVDFGCGNGMLLKKIFDRNNQVIPYGIEIEAPQLEHSFELMPDFAQNFFVGDMFDAPKIFSDIQFELAILMPGRLLETEIQKVNDFKVWLKDHSRQILTYAYGDWFNKYGGVGNLLLKAGLRQLEGDNDGVCPVEII